MYGTLLFTEFSVHQAADDFSHTARINVYFSLLSFSPEVREYDFPRMMNRSADAVRRWRRTSTGFCRETGRFYAQLSLVHEFRLSLSHSISCAAEAESLFVRLVYVQKQSGCCACARDGACVHVQVSRVWGSARTEITTSDNLKRDSADAPPLNYRLGRLISSLTFISG